MTEDEIKKCTAILEVYMRDTGELNLSMAIHAMGEYAQLGSIEFGEWLDTIGEVYIDDTMEDAYIKFAKRKRK